MALARIITRSQACSRELALDLLARGYAVEIVSPDKIPDNIADLELRVDAGPGDQLTATVETHDGERSASLDFVHHLKAPMVDFMRRSPEPRQAVYFSEEPVSFDAESSIEIEDVELPAAVPQLALETVSVATEALREPELDTEEGQRLIPPLEQLPTLPLDPPTHFVVEVATITEPIVQSTPQPTTLSSAQPASAPPTIARPTIVRRAQETQPFNRPAGSFWRVALMFATVILLALVLGYGNRRSDSGKASAHSSGGAPMPEVAAASTGVNVLSAADPEKDPGREAVKPAPSLPPPSATKSEGNSGQVPKESQAAKPVAVTAAGSASTTTTPYKPSRKHSDDLIARDTVTYLDKRFKPAPKATPTKRVAHKHPVSHKQGGVIAANSVTYLNNKPAPKTAKQNSAPNPSNVN
jgi:hypothetical protein